MSPLPAGFGGLSKPAAPKPATPVASTPAPGTAKPALAQPAKPVAAAPAKPTVRPVAAAIPAAPPAKSKAQLMREEAERLEAEEAAQSAVDQESADLAKEVELVHEATVDPEPSTPPVTSKAVSLSHNPFTAALAVYSPADAVNALAAFSEIAEQQRVISLYPVLSVSGGDQGGMFVAPKWQGEEINHRLPEGRKPLQIVFLGYRIEVSIWPVGYDPSSQDRDAPLATAVIPCNDPDTIRLMTKATQTYQFTAKPSKSKFDAVLDPETKQMVGSGHPRPTIEIIAYAPCLKNLLVIRSAPGFGPVQKSIANLARMVDPVTKTIAMFPGEIRVMTDEEKSKSGQVWKTHYFDFSSNVTETGRALAKEFDVFTKGFMADASGMATFNEWMIGGDKKITDEIRARLQLTCQL